MRIFRQPIHFFVLLMFVLLLRPESSSLEAADWSFRVRYSPEIHAEPFSGRVYLIFSRLRAEPRLGPSWFNPELFVSKEVTGWKPGDTITISSKDEKGQLSHPVPFAKMQLAGYRAQAVVRFNPWNRKIGSGAGNGYSSVQTIKNDADSEPPAFEIDRLVTARKFVETKWSKLLNVRSKLLSGFQHRDVFLKAAVILPASYYDQPLRHYPVIFTIPGFGGTHFGGLRNNPVHESNDRGVEFLRVLLDPSCPLGHHVFADSANNGPVGKALISELIPMFDRMFRSIASPSARFLTGHSSGGWSSLWLQVTYPDQFGGTWSTAPDPVDFRDFQRINLYRKGENMYVTPNGEKRPLARSGGRILLWYKGFADMEWTLGHGGQLHSFEAVFSPRDSHGKPMLLWDRKTGEINTDVAKTWEKYDIRLVLERNWSTLGPKLKGKLHVMMGDIDTFYLDGATKLLKESLETLNSDAVVEIVPGRDHGSLLDRNLRNRIRREMTAAFLKQHPDYAVEIEK